MYLARSATPRGTSGNLPLSDGPSATESCHRPLWTVGCKSDKQFDRLNTTVPISRFRFLKTIQPRTAAATASAPASPSRMEKWLVSGTATTDTVSGSTPSANAAAV